jgi:hypothetical protein
LALEIAQSASVCGGGAFGFKIRQIELLQLGDDVAVTAVVVVYPHIFFVTAIESDRAAVRQAT